MSPACESARAGALAHLGNESLPVGQRHVVASDYANRCIAPALQAVDRLSAKLTAEIAALQKKNGVATAGSRFVGRRNSEEIVRDAAR
jgi:hypothetical protein